MKFSKIAIWCCCIIGGPILAAIGLFIFFNILFLCFHIFAFTLNLLEAIFGMLDLPSREEKRDVETEEIIEIAQPVVQIPIDTMSTFDF